MSDLSKILLPLTFINIPYTKETFDMADYHKHDSLELVYISSGSIQMSYYRSKNDVQPKTITVHENQFILIQPGVKHFQSVQTQARMMVLELCHANPLIPVNTMIANSEFVALIPSAKSFLQKMDGVTVFTDIHDVKRIFGKLLTLLYDHQHGKSDEYFTAYYEIYLKQLFVEVFKCINVKTDGKYNRHIQYVLSFIQKNYGTEISIEQIAQSLDLSPVYLNSVFKKALGISIRDHLIAVRMEKAKKLLLEQNLTISATAKKVGYRNLRSFESTFFKKIGQSPTDFIKQHRRDGFVLWKHHADGSIAVDISLSKGENTEN